ncbi:hypothetical protein EXE06_17225 [Acinetobacter pittii]|uniref:hypothetical protein n=1 Tax=Acinetobacter pittii TaxID=48296 RepID=UPI001022DD62|nr:hypothetical protein [Acinetobacter pittii]RZG79986.1 hypothetical protein EXE06_17225 [Acinetobacter pittii]RZH51493.1 hypothetical protein EXD88_17790 [Acinetobacter pittii]RZH54836.1 hypothetical protein EXD90_17430 [Acinetobacter pittii]
MSDIFFNFDGTKWEKFCEKMMRHHYTQPYFTSVPADDRGDCGLEFFTRDGSIFQCYFPDPQYSMAEYKKHVQKKIRTDIMKLKKYEPEIKKFLDDIVIKQWVLLLPENRTKDMISYCNTYKKKILLEKVSYIHPVDFTVKIETADSYPSSKSYALKYGDELINLPFKPIDESLLNNFKDSSFEKNIARKSKFISNKPENFANSMTNKYLKITNYLEDLRFNYPDTYQEIEECGRILLGKMQDLIDIEGMNPDVRFITAVRDQNEKDITEIFSTIISKFNRSELSYGYIAKWIAECNMDFE